MATKWIDFRALRERLDAAQVLAVYDIKLKVKGEQAQGFCPLPTHKAHEGRPKSPSFSINLRRGCFRCFSCGQSGNLIDLAAILEGLNPENPTDIRKAAMILDERFPGTELNRPASSPTPSKSKPSETPPSNDGKKNVANAPLDFALKNLDPNHGYLLSRGFTKSVIERFELGFCSKGLMKDRIAIPLRNHGGSLVGYAGRVVDDTLITDENPRYRFPSGRERDGVYFDFQKSLFLYNGYSLAADGDDLAEIIVCESFTAVWWLTPCGFPHVVSVMGASCSREQGELIAALTSPEGIVTILTDGDEAGERCAVSIFAEVAPRRRVRWARLHGGKQPTDYIRQELNVVLGL